MRLSALSLAILTSLLNVTSFAQSDLAQKGWDSSELATSYHHNSFLQLDWAWHSLCQHLQPRELVGAKKILDYGCGDAKASALLSRIVPDSDITAVDVSSNMLALARHQYPQNRYPNLHLAAIDTAFSSSEHFNNSFDIVMSFSVFHLIDNPRLILQKLRSTLKTNGKLLILAPANRPDSFFLRSLRTVMNKYKLSFPPRSEENIAIFRHEPEKFAELVKTAGFTLQSFNVLETKNAFASIQSFANWVEGTVSGNIDLPREELRSIAREIVQTYLELARAEGQEMLDDFGGVNVDMRVIEAFAIASETSSTQQLANTALRNWKANL